MSSLAVGMLVAAPLVAGTAAVAEPSVLEYQIPAGYGGCALEYGADSPAARRIEVGPSTTTLVLHLDVSSRLESFVYCRSQDDSIPSHYFDVDDTDSAVEFSLMVPTDTFEAGRAYEYICNYGEEVFESWSWTLSSIADAPATVTLDTDPSKLVKVSEGKNYTTPTTENRDVRPGDHIRVTGAPGAWGDPALHPTITVTIADDFIPNSEVSIDNAVLSADASTIDLDLPSSFPADFANSLGALTIKSKTVVPGTDTSPTREFGGSWFTNLIYPSASLVPTTTSLRLNRPIGTPKYPVKAIITVRAPEATRDSGRWQLYVDGEPLVIDFYANPLEPNPGVNEDIVFGGRSTTFSVTLPKLRRGTHTVRAEFTGSDQRSPSVSKEVPLLFLF